MLKLGWVGCCTLLLLGCTQGLVGCSQGGAGAPRVAPTPSTAPNAVSGNPSASSVSVFTRSTSAQSTTGGTERVPVAAEPSAAPAAPRVNSDFNVVAVRAALVQSGRDVYIHDGEMMMGVVDGTRIVSHPEYLASTTREFRSETTVLGGKWPAHGLIRIAHSNTRSAYTTIHERTGKSWRALAGVHDSYWHEGIADYGNGRWISLVRTMWGENRWDVFGAAKGPVPKFQHTRDGAGVLSAEETELQPASKVRPRWPCAASRR